MGEEGARSARVVAIAAAAFGAAFVPAAGSATDVVSPTRGAAAKDVLPADGLGRARARTITVSATAFTLSGRTATGMRTRRGVVAVDPAVIPLGSRMTIPGYGDGVAADTGPNVRGARIDVWLPTRAQALAWGTRVVTVTLR